MRSPSADASLALAVRDRDRPRPPPVRRAGYYDDAALLEEIAANAPPGARYAIDSVTGDVIDLAEDAA